MANLGLLITQLRQDRGQSLQAVADAVGVSKAHIWDIERGKADNPSMGLVSRLADHFSVSIASLVGEDPNVEGGDSQLAAMFREAKQLSERDRQHVSALISSMVAAKSS